jgi:hypothetical protein
VATGNTIDISDSGADGIYILASSDVALSGNGIEGHGTARLGIAIDKSSNISLIGNAITNFAAQAIQGIQDTVGTMDNISIAGGLIANTSYMQFITAGGGTLGTNICHSNIAGWAVGTTSIGLAFGDIYDWKNLRGNFRVTGGDPEGQLIGGVGSTCIRTDGAPGGQLWIKESSTGNTGWRKQGNLLTVEVSVSQSDLAAGGTKTLIAGLSGARYKLRGIRLSGAGTNFSGGGGDRDIAIQDASGTTIWSALTAAKVQALAATDWGQTGVPFPANAAHLTAQSVAGENVVAKYVGGTTDYSAGSLTLVIDCERTT